MSFFRERNKIKTEYSGYQQASEGLRGRLVKIVQAHSTVHLGYGNGKHYISQHKLDHETSIYLNKKCSDAMLVGTYDEAFEALEIFIALAHDDLYQQNFQKILDNIYTAFQSSGSVYTINEQGQVVLHMKEETAENIDDTEKTLSGQSEDAGDYFRSAVRDLLSRKREANDVIKDLAVAMESYLKALTGKNDFRKSLQALQEQGLIAPTQRGVLDKLYAYRGDADGVAHSGNTEKPQEQDAIWFLETLVAQIKLIKTKTQENRDVS